MSCEGCEKREKIMVRMQNCLNCGWWDDKGLHCAYPTRSDTTASGMEFFVDCCTFQNKWKAIDYQLTTVKDAKL